jgi:hypothetical protein
MISAAVVAAIIYGIRKRNQAITKRLLEESGGLSPVRKAGDPGKKVRENEIISE